MATISAVAWHPPPAPKLEGVYAANEALATARLLPTPAAGPEDVAVLPDGTVYTGVEDGSILRFDPDADTPAVVANTGGRPLGIEPDGDGRLVVSDAFTGLHRVSPDGTVETLVSEVAGVPMLHTNNAAVASDGTIYFTDSSRRFDNSAWKMDLLEHSGTGRLLVRRPDGEVEVLLEGLQFANGVALAPDESYLLVAETGAYAIRRYWLTGDRAGRDDPFLENLPGFPDNLSTGEGVFWIAIPSPRDRVVDMLAPRAWARNLVAGLPDRFQPAPKRHPIVLGVDEYGQVIHNLQDSSGRLAVCTGVRQQGQRLYIGSLTEPFLAVHELG